MARRPAPAPTAPRVALPAEIAFLADLVDRAVLLDAARTASRQRVCAARVLMAEGSLSASAYYRALARRLGVAFDGGWPQIDCGIDVAASLRQGRVKLRQGGWLHAPQGAELRALLSGRLSYLQKGRVAITTPAHLAALAHYRAQARIEDLATQRLPRETPRFSAKSASDAWTWSVIGLVAVYFGAAWLLTPRLVGDLFGGLFLASMILRLIAGAAAFVSWGSTRRRLNDADLPTYTVLVPLHREAAVASQLIAALDRLDYPRAKLEVLLLIEPEDHETRDALAELVLPPWVQVVFAPRAAALRTKPRALNIGLMVATGELLAVYDAEDRPDPDQLRLAAATFATRPELACLQARLAIDNGDRSILARMFAVEYAGLFDVLNVGITSLRLPLALGGTSNHFRTAVLRRLGGWDAWNVTEDADLGLRLWRKGYQVGDLASTTREAACDTPVAWVKQRRRWLKGWMQTGLVIARDAPAVVKDVGWLKSVFLGLLLFNMICGPVGLPIFSGLVAWRLWFHGVMTPDGIVEVFESTISSSVPMLGLASTFWIAWVGMTKRGLLRFLPSLPCFLPYQLMISFAAFGALKDLILRPFHWHKTPHGPCKTRPRRWTPFTARRSASRSSR